MNQQTRIRIKRISGAMHFNGTAAVGTPFIKLSWVRYWSANVGTQAVSEAVTVVRKRSSYATRAVTSATTLNVAVQPQLECAQALSTDSGLPMGSILRSNRETYDLCMPLAVTGRSQPFDIQPDALDLEPSEGLALYCLTNSGSNEGGGFGMTGMIEIDEQALR